MKNKKLPKKVEKRKRKIIQRRWLLNKYKFIKYMKILAVK